MSVFNVTIDGTTLFNNRIILLDPAGNMVGGDWLDCSAPLALNLVAGEYRFCNQTSVSDFSFWVNEDGGVIIAPSTQDFMQVMNGNTLKLKGHRVKIDARYLTGDGILWPTAHVATPGDGLANGFIKNEIISLLPGLAYYVQSASGMVSNFYIKLTLDKAWQLLNPATMAPDIVYQRFITLINDAYIPELHLFGYPVLIDGRSARHPLSLMDVHGSPSNGANHTLYDDAGVLMVNLLPQRQKSAGFADNDLYRFATDTNQYSHPGFYITNLGEVGFDPLYNLYFTVDNFNGLTRLTVLYPLPELIA
jgi:hypothetical protein